ncbi:HlyD family secretion protein [Nostoc sp. MS1]|uniref:HlyD family secretion protein n=1 Tax=Nostoc sp. MS1 TaxID=2764711 RepID=UPI001CC45DED|nr:HlyD family secretion protein [Nostoc sp. MS1]BCL37961.1 secretion protein HlyD [Nostoc sp. MS1]
MDASNSSRPLPDQDEQNSHHLSGSPIILTQKVAVTTPSSLVDEPPIVPPEKKPSRKSLRKWLLLGLLGIAGIAGSMYGYRWWQFASTHQETDDAYVTADIHPVNARINGTVAEVAVQDNQSVKLGTILVKLDPHDDQVALQQAQAALDVAKQQAAVAQANINVTSTNAQGQTTQAQGNIDAATASISTAQASLSEAQAGVPVAKAQLAQVEANLIKAKLDYDRYNQLAAEGAVPRAQFDATKAAYDALLAQRKATQEQIEQAQARVTQALENLNNAKAKLASTKGTLQQANSVSQQTIVNRRQYQAALAAIEQAQTQVTNAQLQLSYTTIAAANVGTVGNKTVEVGQRVQPGQTLMSVVSDNPWVVANFKETQLVKMLPGQKVEVKIDSFPDHIFIGKVDSVSPASGARFSLLPPDNATGNFTKIVQRIPIKIVFDPQSIKGYETRISPGMSVVATVETH